MTSERNREIQTVNVEMEGLKRRYDESLKQIDTLKLEVHFLIAVVVALVSFSIGYCIFPSLLA